MSDPSDLAKHVDDITHQGFTVVHDVLVGDELAEARRVLGLYFDMHRGRNDFEGHATERFYTLPPDGGQAIRNSLHAPFMGHLTGSHPVKALAVDYENRVVAQAARAGARLLER